MNRSFVPALAAVTLAACGFAPTGETPVLTERLASRAHLAVDTSSSLAVTAIANQRVMPLEPTVVGGEVVMRTTADGYLLIEDLTLPLADVTVEADVLGPNPVTFTDLWLRLGTQLAIPLPDGPSDTITGIGHADLVLDWAFILDGQVHPLGLRKVVRAPFTVAIAGDDDGTIRASVATDIAGPAVVVFDRYQLRDVHLDVHSDTQPE